MRRKLLIKCSDERSRYYAIVTTIVVENGKKMAVKEAVYPEGSAHLAGMVRSLELLNKIYAPVKACPVREEEGKLVFDYIEGETLEDRFAAAFASGDEGAFEKLLDEYRTILKSSPDNQETFAVTPSYEKVFGDGSAYAGMRALKTANYDATAGNIVFAGEDIYFIDYEWVTDFPVPEAVVMHHCLTELYVHLKGLEEFYPKAKACERMGITPSEDLLQSVYDHFWNYVVTDDNGTSYARSKVNTLKEKTTLDILLKRSVGYQDAVDLYHHMESSYAIMENDRNIWKSRYEAVIASRSYKMVSRLKKIIRK